MLEIKPDIFSYTSDFFGEILNFATQLLREGRAYVDDTPPDVVKQERENRVVSRCRDNCEPLQFITVSQLFVCLQLGGSL